MVVSMVSIRKMRMGMCLFLMSVPMSVLDPWLNRCVMLVLVGFVMYMFVFMVEPLV
jgi:hypothetical protein